MAMPPVGIWRCSIPPTSWRSAVLPGRQVCLPPFLPENRTQVRADPAENVVPGDDQTVFRADRRGNRRWTFAGISLAAPKAPDHRGSQALDRSGGLVASGGSASVLQGRM